MFESIDKLPTTELGAERIERNLQIETAGVVQWSNRRILDKDTQFEKSKKNGP
ncbi:MAG: DUF3781 domain-containing protein [Oscillibacter sp.]|nr:DUF3781 domain-containing protein [Oscillibacter sp.]